MRTRTCLIFALWAFLAGFSGCTRTEPRLTRETVMAGRVCIEWPTGTNAEDVITVTNLKCGAVLSVAPVPTPPK